MEFNRLASDVTGHWSSCRQCEEYLLLNKCTLTTLNYVWIRVCCCVFLAGFYSISFSINPATVDAASSCDVMPFTVISQLASWCLLLFYARNWLAFLCCCCCCCCLASSATHGQTHATHRDAHTLVQMHGKRRAKERLRSKMAASQRITRQKQTAPWCDSWTIVNDFKLHSQLAF